VVDVFGLTINRIGDGLGVDRSLRLLLGNLVFRLQREKELLLVTVDSEHGGGDRLESVVSKAGERLNLVGKRVSQSQTSNTTEEADESTDVGGVLDEALDDGTLGDLGEAVNSGTILSSLDERGLHREIDDPAVLVLVKHNKVGERLTGTELAHGVHVL